MKITYTGRQVELAPAQLKKLEARFAKIGKLLDGKQANAKLTSSCRWSVTCTTPRLPFVTSTISWSDWDRARISSPRSLAPPRNWRSRPSRRAPSGATPSVRRARLPKWKRPPPHRSRQKKAASRSSDRLIYHVNNHKKRKPMTLEEAHARDGQDRDYLVYRDAETDAYWSVLVRRRDGDFDLVEA